MNTHPWIMKAYYADDVKPPKVPGTLAIETRHANEHSLEMEIDAANSRDDIGTIISTKVGQ